MYFYLCKVSFDEDTKKQLSDKQDEAKGSHVSRNNAFVHSVRDATDDINMDSKNKMFFLSELKDGSCQVCAASKGDEISEGEICDYLDKTGLGHNSLEMREITISQFQRLIKRAARGGYLSDSDYINNAFKLENLENSCFLDDLEEGVIAADAVSEEKLKKECRESFSASLVEETERILVSERKKERMGIPVHYMIETDNTEFEELSLKNLLQALYLRGRIGSGRYVTVDHRWLDDRRMEDLYQVSDNGCILIRLKDKEGQRSHIASRDMDIVLEEAERMKKYQNSTLTIFLLPRSCNKLKDLIFQKTQGCTFVEITQDMVTNLQARDYLSKKAEECHAVPDESLYDKSRDEGKMYAVTELNNNFDHWLNRYLKEKEYPEYASLKCSVEEDSKKKAIGDAYSQLQKMTGLSEAKKVIDEALNYYKAQKLFGDRGFQEEHPVMHMVFSGNPGTAKTTVARLFAQIMKDNGLLSNGELIEVGRADLIGEYVGQTAPKVRNAFRRAKGSALFIDEAYSLLDGDRGLYGDEAINTIVQEMENLKEDIVVIFAGYPEEMEQLLDRNPGLRSRIAYHVPFSDYTADELFEIAKFQSEEKGMHLGPDVKEKLLPVFEEARQTENFGNGRFVRNLIEKAQMRQATRLVKMDYDRLTNDDVTTLTAEDFDNIKLGTKAKKTAIGF